MIGNHPRPEDHKDHSTQRYRLLQLAHRGGAQDHEAIHTKARSAKLSATYKWIARSHLRLLRHQTARKPARIHPAGNLCPKSHLHGLLRTI